MPRLFIAVPVAESVTANLARVGRSVDAPGIRWVEQENMHLTLAFLGEVAQDRLPGVEEAVYAATEADERPLRLLAQGLGAFPSDEAARVLWAGVTGDVPRLIDLRSRLVTELREAAFAVDQTRFHPHVTLARFRWPRPVPPRLARLEEYGEWLATEVQVVESRLRPAGPRYVVRADVQLVASLD